MVTRGRGEKELMALVIEAFMVSVRGERVNSGHLMYRAEQCRWVKLLWCFLDFPRTFDIVYTTKKLSLCKVIYLLISLNVTVNPPRVSKLHIICYKHKIISCQICLNKAREDTFMEIAISTPYKLYFGKDC